MAVCPHCGLVSSGRFFCARCNTLLSFAEPPALPTRVQLADGADVDCRGFAGAFPPDPRQPLETTCRDVPCRVYALNPTWWSTLSAEVAQRARTRLDGLAPIEAVAVGDGAVVVAFGLPVATCPLALPPPIDADPLTRLDDALACGQLLARTLTPLHAAGYFWLNFAPERLLVAGDRVQIPGLDLRLFRPLGPLDGVALSPIYSPPELRALRGDGLAPTTDVFHVAIAVWYRLAGCAPGGLPGLGLEAIAFKLPALRIYNPTLPLGIAPVLARGLARDSADRFASVADLAEAMREVGERARRRACTTRAVHVDAGCASAIGRVHELERLPNQDACLLRSPGLERHLAIVCDGVTHSRVGSGEQASRLAVDTLANTLAPVVSSASIGLEDVIRGACLEATQAILDAALGGKPLATDLEPVDVMSTTVVLGVIQEQELTLASVGDSRAYLLHDGLVEQLTVDGDVRCTHLALGAPPEAVDQLGSEALALYRCLGIGEPGPEGTLVPAVERSQPAISRWNLLPGDVVILCTDGLVEEGVFLDPGDLVSLVLGNADRPAGKLAELLVAAAKARHRDPSATAPEGCGDDVTCVVFVVHPREARSAQ